jgi:hypothetical protein
MSTTIGKTFGMVVLPERVGQVHRSGSAESTGTPRPLAIHWSNWETVGWIFEDQLCPLSFDGGVVCSTHGPAFARTAGSICSPLEQIFLLRRLERLTHAPGVALVPIRGGQPIGPTKQCGTKRRGLAKECAQQQSTLTRQQLPVQTEESRHQCVATPTMIPEFALIDA